MPEHDDLHPEEVSPITRGMSPPETYASLAEAAGVVVEIPQPQFRSRTDEKNITCSQGHSTNRVAIDTIPTSRQSGGITKAQNMILLQN